MQSPTAKHSVHGQHRGHAVAVTNLTGREPQVVAAAGVSARPAEVVTHNAFSALYLMARIIIV